MSSVKQSLRILTPGLHIKRWMGLSVIGAVLFLLGLGVRIQMTRPRL